MSDELGDDYVQVINGYALAQDKGLRQLNEKLQSMGEEEEDALRERLRIGVQTDVQVTSCNWGREILVQEESEPLQLITQVFCSAVAVSYASLTLRPNLMQHSPYSSCRS